MEQMLEKYVKGELTGYPRTKLLCWFDAMERHDVPGATFAVPDEVRLYRLLMSTKSTREDIDAFRPFSFDPPRWGSLPRHQLLVSSAIILAMVGVTLLLKH